MTSGIGVPLELGRLGGWSRGGWWWFEVGVGVGRVRIPKCGWCMRAAAAVAAQGARICTVLGRWPWGVRWFWKTGEGGQSLSWVSGRTLGDEVGVSVVAHGMARTWRNRSIAPVRLDRRSLRLLALRWGCLGGQKCSTDRNGTRHLGGTGNVRSGCRCRFRQE